MMNGALKIYLGAHHFIKLSQVRVGECSLRMPWKGDPPYAPWPWTSPHKSATESPGGCPPGVLLISFPSKWQSTWSGILRYWYGLKKNLSAASLTKGKFSVELLNMLINRSGAIRLAHWDALRKRVLGGPGGCQFQWKERYLNKTCFLPILSNDISNTKSEGYCQNSKISFLWTALVHMQSTKAAKSMNSQKEKSSYHNTSWKENLFFLLPLVLFHCVFVFMAKCIHPCEYNGIWSWLIW